MNCKILTGIVSLFFAVMMGWGETVTDSSASFTFPQGVGVKQGTHPVSSAYFKYTGYSSTTGTVTFKWFFPAQARERTGTVAIYSLRGQLIKAFAVTTPAGSLKWNATKDGTGGIYIASFVYGSYKQSIKLILCR